MQPYWTNGRQTLYCGTWHSLPEVSSFNCLLLDPPLEHGLPHTALPEFAIYFGVPVRKAMLEAGQVFDRVSLWFPPNLPSGPLRAPFVPIWTTGNLNVASIYQYPLDFADGARKPVDMLVALLGLARSRIRGVMDPYAGSCSTLAACKILKLPCIGFELDEAKCAIAAEKLK